MLPSVQLHEFPFRLPSSVLTQVFSRFLKLFEVDYLTREYLLFQEGCFNCLIRYEETGGLEVSVRAVDFGAVLEEEGQLDGELAEFKKSILCLFNEYKIVIECCLFENSIPFRVSSNFQVQFFFLFDFLISNNAKITFFISISKN